MKYKLKEGEKVRTRIASIETATVIEAGDLVTVSAGYIVKAAAASTAVAWSPNAHAANSGTEIEVSVGNDFTLLTTGEAAFAIAYKGGEYDINDTTQTIDWDASTTDVLKISIDKSAGVVGSADDIEVRINKPLF